MPSCKGLLLTFQRLESLFSWIFISRTMARRQRLTAWSSDMLYLVRMLKLRLFAKIIAWIAVDSAEVTSGGKENPISRERSPLQIPSSFSLLISQRRLHQRR